MGAAEWLLAVYTVGSFASFLPQIVKLIRTKSADDFSLASWLLFALTSGAWCAYVILYAYDPGAVFMGLLDAALNVCVLILSVRYQVFGKKRRETP